MFVWYVCCCCSGCCWSDRPVLLSDLNPPTDRRAIPSGSSATVSSRWVLCSALCAVLCPVFFGQCAVCSGSVRFATPARLRRTTNSRIPPHNLESRIVASPEHTLHTAHSGPLRPPPPSPHVAHAGPSPLCYTGPAALLFRGASGESVHRPVRARVP